VSTLSTLKVENEAKRINTINQLSEQVKRQNPHYKNLDAVLATNRNNQAGPGSVTTNSIAHVLNPEMVGDRGNAELENVSARGVVSQARATETYRAMREAELSAAEAKHVKLLKRLKRGGHDTSALEQKFQELKARLTGDPIPQSFQQQQQQQPNFNSLNLNLSMLNNQLDNAAAAANQSNYQGSISNGGGVVTSNRHVMNHSSMSMVSEQEQRLNKEKNRLEKQLMLDGSVDGNSSYKMRKILQILKEDPEDDVPAELSEEQLR
jgi:hypothetical protein